MTSATTLSKTQPIPFKFKSMDIKEALATCVSHCNHGAILIEQTDFPKAIRTLTAAFRMCRKFCDVHSNLTCRPRKIREPLSRFDVDVLLSKAKCGENARVQTTNGFIYRHPIQIPHLLERCSESKFLVTTAIAFNLALAYHLEALKNSRGVSTSTMLRRALYLYSAARNLHRATCKGSKALLQMALLNNSGQILHDLREYEKSRLYFKTLLSTILYMTSYKNVDASDYEEFFQNSLPRRSLAASAA
jgi:hypothetical protein